MTEWRKRLGQGALLAAVAVLVWLSAWCAIVLTKHDGRIATVWIANGIWLGATLLASRRLGMAMLAAGFLGDLAANLTAGDGVATAMLLDSCNLLEVALSTVAMRLMTDGPIRLSRQATFLRFLAVCVVGSPLLSALLASVALAVLGVEPVSLGFVHWFLADALGVGIVTPAILAADAGELARLFRAPLRARTLRLFCILMVSVATVFCQDRYPLLFVLPPVIAVMAAELGPAANTLSIPVLTFAAFAGTLGGHGPFNLNQALEGDERMLLIQIFLLSAFVLSAWVANVAEARARAIQELASANKQLQALASTDPLTALPNRREFDRALLREVQLAARGAGPLSLLLIDIDHFKQVNDNFGHAAGDERLREIAGRIQIAARRPNDLPARLGGEEFGLILPGTGPEAARRIAELLRADISRLRWDVEEDRLSRMTVSIGAATLERPSHAVTPEMLLAMADGRLYDAKREGRDRVRLQVYGAAPEPVPMLRLVARA